MTRSARRVLRSCWALLRFPMAPGTGKILFLTLCLVQPLAAAAHDDPSNRIKALTRQIQVNPNNAALLLKRGTLLRQAEHYEEALRDFEQAAKRDRALRETDYQRGLTLLQLKRAAKAKPFLDRYIAEFPKDAQALATRARTLLALGDNRSAAVDFSRAIAESPLPGYYLERAKAQAAAGRIAEALEGLDRGLSRLGVLGSIQRAAIDLEISRNNIDGAIARVNSMAAITGRADIWLARRGDILHEAGRRGEARAAYIQALAAIETLPTRRKRSKAVRALKVRLTGALRKRAVKKNATSSRGRQTQATQFP